MFHTLEATWDRSAHRGWTTVISFTMQALALSLLFLIPLITIEGPPHLLWFDPHLLAPPPAPPSPALPAAQTGIRGSSIGRIPLAEPPSISPIVARTDYQDVPTVPDVRGVGVLGGTGPEARGTRGSVGDPAPISPLPPPAPTHPLRVSHWAEGNLIFRVQPTYPVLARHARVQGTVELRAIIGKAGTIENLAVLSGQGMLVTAAVEAVRQWRYRPYLLNGEPIEVETEIRVNFMLAGN
ncbi:MAG: energy transducer TonB [Terriglobales bacterium]